MAPSDSTVERIKDWVTKGGTLILVRGAAAWAAGEKVGLLATTVEKKPAADDEALETKPSDVASTPDGERKKADEAEPPDPVPGAFLRARVYDDHWVTFGVDATIEVMMSGNVILSPLAPKDGRNLVTFAASDVLSSGFCWPDTLKQIAGKPYVLYQSLGDGHVIAFTDDPNFRAMYPQLQRLFLNAALFGPGH